MEEREYIENQISVIRNNKKLIETLDYLEVAPLNKFATLHANGDIIKNKKLYSVIKLNLKDYSFGKGNKIKSVDYNLPPNDIAYIFYKIKANENFIVKREKYINGEVYRFFLEKCNGYTTIVVEEGVGEGETSITGWRYLKEGTYTCNIKISIKLNDDDLFKLFYETNKFIEIWETTYCTTLIKEGIENLKNNINKNNKEI